MGSDSIASRHLLETIEGWRWNQIENQEQKLNKSETIFIIEGPYTLSLFSNIICPLSDIYEMFQGFSTNDL